VAPIPNDSHVTRARMTLTSSVVSPSSSSTSASSTQPAQTDPPDITLEDVENQDDEQILQKILGQLTDISPETYEKRKAIRQRILDLKSKAREEREKERQDREKRREEDVAKRRKEREQERMDRFQRIQDLTKTRPDPTTTSQDFLKKRRDSATKMREKESEVIRKISMTRQKSIAEEVRDEEFKAKMELAKEDRERQMQCMQDIRKMSITGASWKTASPSLSPSSFMSFKRQPITRGSSNGSSVDGSTDANNNAENEAEDPPKGVKSETSNIPSTQANHNKRLQRQEDSAKDPESSSSSPAATSNPLSNGPSRATLLLSPTTSSNGSRGLKAMIQAEESTNASSGNSSKQDEDSSLPFSSAPRFPNAPPLRRTSRSWTMPRQSGTEFRRNSRVQPTNVADAKKRFEVDKGPSKDGVVTRSQSFSPASAASSATTIKASLLAWCQQKTRGYRGVDIKNFSSSWADGLAFAAISHHYAPDAFDFNALDPADRRNTMEIAFRVADEALGAMALLEVDDMIAMKDRPDWKCVFTYVQSLYRHGRDFEAKRAKCEE